MRNRTRIQIVIGLAIVALIGGYVYATSIDFIRGPAIVLERPSHGETSSRQFIEVTGTARRISKIYMNDRQIFTDDSGAFREPLLLSAGYNILEIRAEDRFGREEVQTVELVYNSPERR